MRADCSIEILSSTVPNFVEDRFVLDLKMTRKTSCHMELLFWVRWFRCRYLFASAALPLGGISKTSMGRNE